MCNTVQSVDRVFHASISSVQAVRHRCLLGVCVCGRDFPYNNNRYVNPSRLVKSRVCSASTHISYIWRGKMEEEEESKLSICLFGMYVHWNIHHVPIHDDVIIIFVWQTDSHIGV